MTQYEIYDNDVWALVDDEPHPLKLNQSHEFTHRMEISALKHKGNVKPEDLNDLVYNYGKITSKSLSLPKNGSSNLNANKDETNTQLVHRNSDTTHFSWFDHDFKSQFPQIKSGSIDKPSFDCEHKEFKVKSTKTSMKDEISFLLRKLSMMHGTNYGEFQEIHEENVHDNKFLASFQDIQIINNNYLITMNEVEAPQEN